ncbi:helix-turn-helix domain-containing protein [Fictibacillus sp. WQ 8-8]|uniref:helix-turn-helix domain-containing protein n=1 Tax=Fictibacillus sp. WQ 8-8 TaxID=2938788 RepID=UPI002108D193|nr:helix-turn-helix domain-containing protein [Fictibacillus sp. WQ 8-8]MCQ6268324.1 helix-turn-helix domain-containing protein [Fictibacillus sp. WQ 8-8]
MVGQRIRYYRKTKGLTQEELAQGICSVSYLSKIEKGDAKSSEEVINLLCERLGISPEEVDSNEILELLNEWNMLMVNRRFEEADDFFEKVQEKMQIVNEPELILRFEIFSARYHITKEKPDAVAAQNLLSKVESLKEQLNSELNFYFNLTSGSLNILQNNYQLSIKFFKKAEEIYNNSSNNINDSNVALLYYFTALSYGYLMRISAVNSYAFKAIAIFDKEYNYSRSADCQILLAISYRRVQNYEQAIFHLNQALKYSTSFHDDFTSGVIYHNLGYVFSCRREHVKAIEHFKKALRYKEKSLDPERITTTTFLLAQEYFNINDLDQAEYWINKSFETLGDDTNNDIYYHLKVLDFRVKGTNSEEFDTFISKEAIPHFEKRNMWEYVSLHSELLADFYFDQSQYKKASHYYRIANNARKNIF